jgi:hypothetical protein
MRQRQSPVVAAIVGILTWGSHGDIRPVVARMDGLQAVGYQIMRVVTCVESLMMSPADGRHRSLA